MAIVAALQVVDAVFVEEALDLKPMYIAQYEADVLVMGDDWQGKFDDLSNVCRVIYLPRTPSVSTTATIERIRLPSDLLDVRFVIPLPLSGTWPCQAERIRTCPLPA